ncbi:FAD-dependent oxidoreductase [Lolliginicoccus suaedae]|uniref:FAD-dependent oxidoreductase n=1 Tax=Lolliginicoccus suaedae TaxID=2605429 RepID=UPI0011ED288C|nr:FAD-dependent oxidoreductase [Lolliginicoccus suaedae]
MGSLWLDTRSHPAPRAISAPAATEVLIIGAGLTGLVCGLECARAGIVVTLIDRHGVAGLTTGKTTAKATCLQGDRISRITRTHGADAAREYVATNQSALEWLRQFCASAGVATQERSAYSIAQDEATLPALHREAEAARAAGLDVGWGRGAPLDYLPFPIAGFVGLERQAQCDPVELSVALAEAIIELGGTILEGITARGATMSGATTVHTSQGDIATDRVVLATGTPILDRGGFFATLEPQRSYLAAYPLAPDALRPEGMYVSIDPPENAPSRSVRSTPDHLLVGGNGHVTGRASDTRERERDLRDWTARYFPGLAPSHQWSAQDYRSIDGLPLVGRLLAGSTGVLMASGYAKWGMTNGIAAGRILAARITGSDAPGMELFDSQRALITRRLPSFLSLNAHVGTALAAGLPRLAQPRREPPAEGEGYVHWHRWRPVATSTVDGATCTVSAICPHLKGLLAWNRAERTWDCPLHGSRFEPDGSLIEGPATRGLGPCRTLEWKGSRS